VCQRLVCGVAPSLDAFPPMHRSEPDLNELRRLVVGISFGGQSSLA
jgi:hypothetical protein